MKRTLYALTIVIVSFIYSQDSTKQISINLPSGIDIDLKGKVEFEFVDVEGEGGAINSTEFIQKYRHVALTYESIKPSLTLKFFILRTFHFGLD